MDEDAPRALTGAALALAWWSLLAMLVWVCFLREPPRSLALTVAWFAMPRPPLLIAVLVLLLAGALRARLPGPGRGVGLVSAATALLTTLSWCTLRLLP